jgi:ATP-dependent DNA ligase
MQPTLVPRPIRHEGWVYEEEVGAYRVVACKEGDEMRLISR